MSTYEDYDEVSKSYDKDRYPDGADIIASLLRVHGGKPLKVCVFLTFQKFTETEYNCITKTRLFKSIENFTTPKEKFLEKKKSDIFHISAQNIDCGYSLEPRQRGGSNEYTQSMLFSKLRKIMYTPINPSFTM